MPAWRAMWLRVEGHWAWYRRYWRSSLYSSGVEPLLFLAAMGLGFGSQVEAGAATGGFEYLHYVAPALLVAGAAMSGMGEASFPVLSGFKWQKDYIAVTSTPITPGQLLGGQLLWLAIRLGVSGVVYGLVALAFGAWLRPGAVLVVGVGVVTGLACAAPVMALAAATYDEGRRFVVMFRFVMVPMMLFSATFFPISQIPIELRWLAWLSPLWHGNEIARAAALGDAEPLALAGHGSFLAALLVAGIALARKLFYRRLVV
ncbi:ABC transporter permease [Haloechinothrix salitolerans]